MSLFKPYDEQQRQYSDNPRFEEWNDNIVTKLFEANSNLSTLQQLIKGLETNYAKGKSSTAVVVKINNRAVKIISVLSDLVKELNALVHKVNDIARYDLDNTQLVAREKLTRDVKYSVQEFQKYQLEFTKITKKINDAARDFLNKQQQVPNDEQPAEYPEAQEGAHVKQTIVIEREPINNEEFAYQQNLIREREEEIANIEKGIVTLNSIFQDLGSIVQQQGELVDNIESNIYSAVQDTLQARTHLDRASRRQRTPRWVYIVVLVIFTMLFLIIMSS